ncbi:Uncharacterized protein KIAA1522, partial [Anas platyrhynchos]
GGTGMVWSRARPVGSWGVEGL